MEPRIRQSGFRSGLGLMSFQHITSLTPKRGRRDAAPPTREQRSRGSKPPLHHSAPRAWRLMETHLHGYHFGGLVLTSFRKPVMWLPLQSCARPKNNCKTTIQYRKRWKTWVWGNDQENMGALRDMRTTFQTEATNTARKAFFHLIWLWSPLLQPSSLASNSTLTTVPSRTPIPSTLYLLPSTPFHLYVPVKRWVLLWRMLLPSNLWWPEAIHLLRVHTPWNRQEHLLTASCSFQNNPRHDLTPSLPHPTHTALLNKPHQSAHSHPPLHLHDHHAARGITICHSTE